MNRAIPIRTAAAIVLAASLGVALPGCKTAPTAAAPDLNKKPEVKVTEGGIVMPAGANYRLVELAEKGEKPAIYAQVRGMGDPSNEKLLFPANVAARIGLTPAQIQRRFMDTIGKTKRYDVYSTDNSVVAEASKFVVDAQFVGSTQEIRRLEGGVRVAVTRVQINANLIHRFSGKPIWDAPVEAVGTTGGSSSDRIALMPGENERDPAAQEKLGIDYQTAMQRAFDRLAARIDSDLRPMGKVAGVDGDGITAIAGLRNGLQRGDELVVFSAGLVRIGGQNEFVNMKPVAALRCNGVGAATSQCDVIRRNPQQAVKVGDYVILTDHSAGATRAGL